MDDDITSTGALYRFFNDNKCWVRGKGQPITHTILTKDKVYVRHDLQNAFHAAIARCIDDPRGLAQYPNDPPSKDPNPMMSISEVHTMVFPMFVDLDLSVDTPIMDLATKTRLGVVATAQLERFFPEREFRCVVCDKALAAKEQGDFAKIGVEWVVLTQGEKGGGDDDDEEEDGGEEGNCHDPCVIDVLLHAVLRANTLRGPSGSGAAAIPRRLQLTELEHTRLFESGVAILWTTRVFVGGCVYRPSGRWKHGLHLHWPKMLVNYDRACQMRLSVVNALQREHWPELGEANPVDPAATASTLSIRSIPWCDVVDERVYQRAENGGGLRMVHAPKATECKECTIRSASCGNCKRRNNGCIVDPAFYKLCTVLQGGDVDVETTLRFRSNAVSLLRNTSVRCWANERETEPYVPYAGCPCVPTSSSSGGGAPTMRAEDVSTPELRRHAKAQLLKHDATHYAFTTIVGIFPLGKHLVVRLSGDGAAFCLNKQACHGKSRAYMMVWRRGLRMYSDMRCYCKKREVRSLTGKACPDYKSPEKELSGDCALLFGAVWPATGGGKHPVSATPCDTKAQVTVYRMELEKKRKRAEEAAFRVSR